MRNLPRMYSKWNITLASFMNFAWGCVNVHKYAYRCVPSVLSLRQCITRFDYLVVSGK